MSTATNHLLVMAGGTGGHVFPALAVANALRAKGTRVTWLGTRQGLEATVVAANGIEISWITIEGLRGKGLSSWLLMPFKLAKAIMQSLAAMRRLRPDCVLGMGGFVAGPGGLAARMLGKPLIVHEQNAVAGLTNKYLAKIAQKILLGFPKVADLPSSAQWVGNPVRDAIAQTYSPTRTPSVKPKVLVIGGSQGAHSLNLHLPQAFAKHNVELEIWHQCGVNRQREVEQRYLENQQAAQVTEFIDDMAAAYAWADFLVCRAGAMTIAECCAAGKPALLVPYPHSAGDHQDRNAEFMVAAGAAVMLDNAALDSNQLEPALQKFTHHASNLAAMSKAARSLYKADTLDTVVAACEEYLHA